MCRSTLPPGQKVVLAIVERVSDRTLWPTLWVAIAQGVGESRWLISTESMTSDRVIVHISPSLDRQLTKVVRAMRAVLRQRGVDVICTIVVPVPVVVAAGVGRRSSPYRSRRVPPTTDAARACQP